jgi:hypothetical protein
MPPRGIDTVRRVAGVNELAQRYCLSLDEIKRRATLKAVPVSDLEALPKLGACKRLREGLKAVFYPTEQCCRIIQEDAGRARAHALSVYAANDPIGWGYDGVEIGNWDAPNLLTGLAGSGKTALLAATNRVLGRCWTVYVDQSHPKVDLVGHRLVLLTDKSSVIQALQPLGPPPVARGDVRLKDPMLRAEAARWQRQSGNCLFGVDELQGMTQSEGATTLITKTLLAFGTLQTPWTAGSNYSLCWKLLKRPSEAQHRLLSQPVVLCPDPPESDDWLSVLAEYEVVCGEYFSFSLVAMAEQLWKLTAGIKRNLIELLVNAYSVSRDQFSQKVYWQHVIGAYRSRGYGVFREEVQCLIRHRGQGGALRTDLECPFKGAEDRDEFRSFMDALDKARSEEVAAATIQAAMTAEEKRETKALERKLGKRSKSSVQPPSMARRARPTLQEMQEAHRRRLASIKNRRAVK